MDNKLELVNYELLDSKLDDINRLFYAVMYRQWAAAGEIVKRNNYKWDEIKENKFNNSGLTLEYCFRFNMDFLNSQSNMTESKMLKDTLGDPFGALESGFDFCAYDDKRFFNKQSVFDVFWPKDQPVLNLKYFEKQTLAAKQVMNNRASMVLDEVGTGKTVAGIYTIQQIIQEALNDNNAQNNIPQILVICPYNKREDWHTDILRQLGLESTTINQSDNGVALKCRGARENARANIYISGNKCNWCNWDKTEPLENGQLKKSFFGSENPWDLVIVDECHSCFDSYGGVRAKRVLLLTATPIVVKGQDTLSFKNYRNRINDIIGPDKRIPDTLGPIDPIACRQPDENDIFVCNFKEDIFNIKIERQIFFIECDRDKRRQEWFEKLRAEKGFFKAIFADQDDESLVQKMEELGIAENVTITENFKLNKLCDIITGNYTFENDSFIVYCETKETVARIYKRLSTKATKELMIGRLDGDIAEIKNEQANRTNILQIMKSNIRGGNRSVLITTGKSGGTAINLGEFTAVIHYELPFTSNELEQRFGRIERADDLIRASAENKTVPIKNKMIFLVNKTVDNEMDFVTNRMLYYAISKINITMNYMPIRNTVLFHNEYMKRILNEGLRVWGSVQKLDYQKWAEAVLAYVNSKAAAAKVVNPSGQGLFTPVSNIINYCNNNYSASKQSADKEALTNYVKEHTDKYYENNEKALRCFINYIEYYLILDRTLSFWEPETDKLIKKQGAYGPDDPFLEKTPDESDQKGSDDETENRSVDPCEKEALDILVKLAEEKDIKKAIDDINSRIADMGSRLHNFNPEGATYSGLFYRNESKIIHVKKQLPTQENGENT